MERRFSFRALSVSVFCVFGIVWALSYSRPVIRSLGRVPEKIQNQVRQALAVPLHENRWPDVLEFDTEGGAYQVPVRYTLNEDLQREMERLIGRWGPDYCAFVALDARTGRVLTMVSYARNPHDLGNLALRASFPAASVFKVVSATAAIDVGEVTPDTVFAFNGADHTLYRRNVTSDQRNRWTRFMPLRKAFARSVNTVFGKLGIQHLDGQSLEAYAERFFFNRPIPGDLPVQPGHFRLKEGGEFALAELASGFNRIIRISPLQGALIAAAVANDGVIMAPHVVDTLLTWDGVPAEEAPGGTLYQALPRGAGTVMSPETAQDMRELMRETVVRGTARSAFSRMLRRQDFPAYEIGGKTGSLRGDDPVGSNDWFVGYAISDSERIAVAALTVNVDKWRIKSSVLARKFFQIYFRRPSRDAS